MKRDNDDEPGNQENSEDYQNGGGNQENQESQQEQDQGQDSGDQDSQNNGSDRPAKRIRRDTDEEVRLLIPSKVSDKLKFYVKFGIVKTPNILACNIRGQDNSKLGPSYMN